MAERTPPAPRPDAGPLDLDQLVDISVGLFLRRGYDGTTMQQIAQLAGVRKASLYHHVTGKEELLEIATGRALGAFETMLAEPGASEDEAPRDRLRYVLGRTCELVARHLPEVAVLMRARGNTTTERRILTERRRLNTLLAEMVHAVWAVEQRDQDVEPELAARLIFGMITSTVDWWQPRGGTLTPGDLAAAVERMTSGLLPPSSVGSDRR